MLDDHHGRLVELFHQLQRRIGIEVVVVRHGFSVQGGRTRHGGLARPRFTIERALLVRILAVSQEVGPFIMQRQHRWKSFSVRGLSLQVAGDQAVVARRMLKDFRRQLAPELGRHRAGFERVQHTGVIGRVHQDQHLVMIFCGGAQHRGATDIDVLDRVLNRAVRSRDRLLERIEIDRQHVDGIDPVPLHLGHVRGVAAATEQSSVDFRVQRLDPTVQDFR